MKRLLIILLTVTCPQWVVAQSAPRSRVPSSPGQVRQAPVPRSKPAPRSAAAESERLRENITLQISGDFQGLLPLELELTGVGPLFSTDLAIESADPKMPPNVITFQATVRKENDARFHVDYSLGARISLKTSAVKRPDGTESFNIEYRDVVLRGTVLLKKGAQVTISKLNGKELKISVAGE